MRAFQRPDVGHFYAPPSRKVVMTEAQERAQDETRRVLDFYCRQAQSWLKKLDTSEGLCPCQFPLSKCRCEFRKKATS